MAARKRRVRQAPIVQAFATRLRTTRLARQMTQRDLADRAGIPMSYVSRLEAGGAAPGIDLLARLAKTLHINPADLLPPTPSPEIAEANHQRLAALFETVVRKAGTETLGMLTVFLDRLSESVGLTR